MYGFAIFAVVCVAPLLATGTYYTRLPINFFIYSVLLIHGEKLTNADLEHVTMVTHPVAGLTAHVHQYMYMDYQD